MLSRFVYCFMLIASGAGFLLGALGLKSNLSAEKERIAIRIIGYSLGLALFGTLHLVLS